MNMHSFGRSRIWYLLFADCARLPCHWIWPNEALILKSLLHTQNFLNTRHSLCLNGKVLLRQTVQLISFIYQLMLSLNCKETFNLVRSVKIVNRRLISSLSISIT
jgi:hypothetical protein